MNASATHGGAFFVPRDEPMDLFEQTLAAYVGVPYDATNRLGIFEPVCTHPNHRRRGLARTLMLEGLRRLQAIGARDVMVDTGDMIPANRLYDSIGFSEVVRVYGWRKLS